MSRNVVQLFFDAADRNASKLAFVTADGASVTFAELRRDVERFAGGLAANGFQSQDRAVCMLGMSPQLYVAVLGVLAAGGVVVFVDPWVTVRAIARLAAASRPAAFIGPPKAHALRMLEAELRRVPITISTAGFGARMAARFVLREMEGAASVASVAADAPALITYTTGSSGRPKGVNRTHDILAAQHEIIRQEFPAEPNDVDLTTFPVFALSNLAAGVTTVIPPVDLRRVAEADGGRVLNAARRFGVTTMATSPPLVDRLVEHARATGEIPALRRIVTGGAPVSDAQIDAWLSVLPQTRIVIAYGSSEAEPVASMTAAERRLAPTTRGYCVGKPVAAVRARVVGISRRPIDEALDLRRGEIGELIVAGPHVCRDYAGDEQAFRENKVRDADGTVWHRMGDTGRFDDEGRFWLMGRVHSTIVRAGVQYHAQVVEQIARADDTRIRNAAAIAVADGNLGERLVVVIESDDRSVETAVRQRLEGADIVVDAVLVTGAPLPVDPRHNSKVDYKRVRERLAKGKVR